MTSDKPSRRSVLKSIGGTAVLAGVAGVGNAQRRRSDTGTGSSPESPFDFEYRTVGADVRDAVGRHWWLLTVDHDRLDELVAKSPSSEDATRKYQEVIKELRSKYEVELGQDEDNERELTYHLTDGDVQALHETSVGTEQIEASDHGKDAVSSAASSVGAGLGQEAGSVETEHSGSIHRKMAEAAASDLDLYDFQLDDLKDGSVDPDQWDQKCRVCSDDWLYLGDRFDWIDISPDTVEEEVREAIRDIDDSASPHHMYVPGQEEIEVSNLLAAFIPSWITFLEIEVEGAAPQDAQTHWEYATMGYYTDYTELGQSLHFLQDMSQPLHTGEIASQALETRGTVHHAYKNFIEDNWTDADDTSMDFRERFNDGASNPIWDGSMEDACEAVAGDSTNYSSQVYETIVENGANNRDDWDEFVENSAYACMWFVGAYSRGAMNQL